MNEAAFNGEMLSLARQTRKVSQPELAKCIGSVSQGQLSKIEHGQIQPSESLVHGMAGNLRYKPSFFYNSSYRPMPPMSLHRKRQKLSARDLDAIHGQCEVYRLNIKKMIGAVELEARLPSSPSIDPDQYGGDIGHIALTVRQRWGLPRGPVKDLTRLVEDSGIIIVPFDFGTPLIDGFCQQSSDSLPGIIFINSRQPKDRFRFSLAHELGHLVMHQTPNPDMELQAHLFAAEFLMPNCDIRHQLDNLSITKFMELKLYWGASMQSLIYKAWQTGRISDRMFKYYNIEMSRRGFRTNEPVEWNGSSEAPSTLRQLLQAFTDELKYSITDLSELFGLLEEEVTALYQLAGHRKPRLRIVV